MKTLRLFSDGIESIPTVAAWYLSDVSEARGRQDLYVKQAPQRLNALKEHAIVESAVSSNRIEGVEIDRSRIDAVFYSKKLLRDRNEEEVRGYRDALRLLHAKGANLPLSEELILDLHRMTRGEIWDAGRYKEKDGDIIEKYPDGRSRVRFRTVPAAETPAYMLELVALWESLVKEPRLVHPLVLAAAFNLDFLCVHPFRDGNGRVSRLLLLLQSYQLGYEVGRYISLERLIEENKERYYETLEQSSQGWHEAKHDPWPFVNFVLSIFRTAYKQFEERVGQTASPRGSKTELVIAAIDRSVGPFRLVDLQRSCPGVSIDLVRRVLKKLSSDGLVRCLGQGRNATWEKTKEKTR
jgi:Fic family protein